MHRVSFERMKGAVPVVALVGLAACGGSAASKGVTRPVITTPAKVIVSPASAAMGYGVHFQFHAVVEDSAGALTGDQTVDWSLTPPSTTISIDDSGVVTDACYPGGMATVVARSVADSSLTGTAQVIVAPTTAATVSIATINDAATGGPADLDSLTDSVRVTTNVSTAQVPCVIVREADLVIHRPAGDTIVDRMPLDTVATAGQTVTLTFHSDAKAEGVAQFPNGSYAMHVEVPLPGGRPTMRSSTINFTIRNP